MPAYSAYTAEVIVDGEALPEFDVRHSVIKDHGDMGRVVCWIPSEAKKTFAIRLHDGREKRTATAWNVHIDGERMDTAIIHSRTGVFGTKSGTNTFRKAYTKKLGDNEAKWHSLAFGDMQLTEDDRNMSGKEQDIGLIRLRVFNCEVREKRTAVPTGTARLSTEKVNEKRKKAGTHRAEFQKVQKPLQKRFTYECKPPAIVEFVFNYRPLAVLQAQAIAPIMAEPSKAANMPHEELRVTEIPPKDYEDEAMEPPTTEVKHDEAESEDEDQELLELQSKINDIMVKKQSRRTSIPAAVKKEETPARKRRKMKQVESDVVMIDLTSD